MTDVSGLFLAVLISDCLTGLLLKPALILTKSLTRDPYNRGFLKKRKSVVKILHENVQCFSEITRLSETLTFTCDKKQHWTTLQGSYRLPILTAYTIFYLGMGSFYVLTIYPNEKYTFLEKVTIKLPTY